MGYSANVNDAKDSTGQLYKLNESKG